MQGLQGRCKASASARLTRQVQGLQGKCKAYKACPRLAKLDKVIVKERNNLGVHDNVHVWKP